MTAKKQGWHNFLALCREAQSMEQLNEFFDVVLTIEEKQTFALRIELIKELLSGQKTQRVIARDLNISIAKITRGSNALKMVTPELKAFLTEHLLKEAKTLGEASSTDS